MTRPEMILFIYFPPKTFPYPHRGTARGFHHSFQVPFKTSADNDKFAQAC